MEYIEYIRLFNDYSCELPTFEVSSRWIFILTEMGRRFSFGDYQALIRFYGKKMKVTFEDEC